LKPSKNVKSFSQKSLSNFSKDTAGNKQGVPTNLKQIIESENFSVDTVSFDLKQAIQRARQQKGWNQTELARAIMEKQTVIADYESGRAIPNPNIINKLERALGVRLPRQKAKKDKKNKDDDN